MQVRFFRWLAAGAAALAGLAVLGLPHARSQINAAPSWVPVGVSARGSGSTVWFHEPSSRQTAACQTAAGADGAPSGIRCVTARLP
jgi:hypothetical protein